MPSMADHSTDPDLPEPTPASDGEPVDPGEGADPLTAPEVEPGDGVHESMIEESGGDQMED